MRFAEELLLLMRDGQTGEPLPLAPQTERIAFAGAVLMELELARRIDTEVDTLVLHDPTPLGDDLLDPVLADIAGEARRHDVSYWVERVAERRGEKIRERAIARLVEQGILADEGGGGLPALTRRVSRVRRYPLADGTWRDDIHLRVMRVLLADDIPDPGDIVIISLANACGLFRQLLSPAELEATADRTALIGRMDLLGQAVTRLVRRHERAAEEARKAAHRPPEMPGLRLVGSVLEVMEGEPALFAKYYRELGPVFRIRLLGRDYTVLAGPEANRFMAREERFHLSTGDLWDDFRRELGASRFLLGMDGAEHHRMRRELRDGFSRALIERRIPDAVRIVRKHVDGWKSHEPQPGFHVLQRIAGDQLGTLAAGTPAAAYLDDVILAFKQMMMTLVVRSVPGVLLKAPRFVRARRRMLELCSTVVAEHRLPDRPEARDLIDDLIALHRTDPAFMPETDLAACTLIPFIAGIDTSASAAAFMLYVLLTHPELQERVRAEADAAFADGLPTVEKLRALDVTHRVAMETLRVYPVFRALRRRAATSFDFGGFRIPAGAELFLAISVPHFLPECFPEPERFDIDRYLPDRAEHRQPGAYAPFGFGAHRCLGAGFAEVQIALTVATLLHDNVLEMDPPSYRMKIVPAPFQSPDAGFQFRVTARRGG